MKSGLKKNVFARKFKFTSRHFGGLLASICVSLEERISAFGPSIQDHKASIEIFPSLYRRPHSVDFVYSFIYLLYYTSKWQENRE